MEHIRISNQATYLAAYRTMEGAQPPTFKVRMASALTTVISSWNPSTRVSPLWRIESVGDLKIQECTDGELSGELLFIGPTRPHKAFTKFLLPIAANCIKAAWISLGLYNIVILLKKTAATERIKSALTNEKINWEQWSLKRDTIQNAIHFNRSESCGDWRVDIAEIVKIYEKPESKNKTALQEFLPLIASSLARAELHAPRFLPSIEAHLSIVKSALESKERTDAEKQGQLTHINAALSRFSALAFAGTSPILTTESNFWMHSLLGAGTASIGLQNLADYIYENMGLHLVPERIEATKDASIGTLPILSHIETMHTLALLHHLDECEPAKKHGNAKPLVTYFSGRDGFKSNVSMISVPLSSIAAANAKAFSLMTLTHEVSHIVIGAVLHKLIPLRSDEEGLYRCIELAKSPEIAKNRFEVLQATLMQSFISLAGYNKNQSPTRLRLTPRIMGDIIGQHLLEVTEILVHIFDFMYFYGSKHDIYVEGIWETWSTIPNISSRISEYVIRTGCALTVRHLPRKSPEIEAAKQLKNILTEIVSRNPENAYAKEAVRHIRLSNEENTEHSDNPSTDILILQRMSLVQFVHAYLFSPALATKLQIDPMSKGRESEHGGYSMREKQIAPDLFSNPLSYIKEFTRFSNASSAESAILWQELAFYYQSDTTRRI